MDIKRIHEMKECLTSWALAEIQKGKECICTEEMGEVIDMIKDLADAEKNCYEAKMFKTEIEEHDNPMEQLKKWYTPMRNSMGRFTSHGRRNYEETDPIFNAKDPKIYNMNDDHSEYGHHYDKYTEARRYYASTKSPEYKKEMDKHAYDHMEGVIDTMEDIWHDADPEMRKQMKTKLQKLVSEMA